jgi:hypothetical protein
MTYVIDKVAQSGTGAKGLDWEAQVQSAAQLRGSCRALPDQRLEITLHSSIGPQSSLPFLEAIYVIFVLPECYREHPTGRLST